MFNEIPLSRPDTPLLDTIESPQQLRQLSTEQLPTLARELRAFLLYSVGQTGGHFGAGLGVVELTIALHYLLDTPNDHLVWDVGHQSYPHKILTGRREQLLTIRQKDGLSPFPKRKESKFDDFGTGHSSTSISVALGMALADRLNNQVRKSVAVIGDGAMTAGMAFEALNHAGHTKADMLVVLNDNDMSISHNEGGLATYLSSNLKARTDAHLTPELFDALEFEYTGPVDGNDLQQLLPALQKVLSRKGPQFLHITTVKGKGLAPAEADPVGYHAITKIEPVSSEKKTASAKFCNIFGQWLCDQAAADSRLVGITPAMREGSDLIQFSKQFPERYFDVAIAEQHAVTLAAGMACAGSKPVVAIYSTFLQRAYDQLIHDVTIQNLDVLFAIDRAGLVGEDGATHAGCYDISFLRTVPDIVIMTPSDEQELRQMLCTGYQYKGPAAVRYPRGSGTGIEPDSSLEGLPLGKGRLVLEGDHGCILSFGTLLPEALNAARSLGFSVADMRFVKPLDTTLLQELAARHKLLITVEDHSIAGGAGSAVLEHLHQLQINLPVLTLGIPDRYIDHASRTEQLAECQLDSSGILESIQRFQNPQA